MKINILILMAFWLSLACSSKNQNAEQKSGLETPLKEETRNYLEINNEKFVLKVEECVPQGSASDESNLLNFIATDDYRDYRIVVTLITQGKEITSGDYFFFNEKENELLVTVNLFMDENSYGNSDKGKVVYTKSDDQKVFADKLRLVDNLGELDDIIVSFYLSCAN